jgi:ankyrin repeat protein
MIYNGGEVDDLPDFYSQECHPLMDFTPEHFTEHVFIRKIAVCFVIAVLGLGALACGITGNQGSEPTTALSSTAAAEGLAKTDETGDDPEAEITALKKADSFTVDPVDSSGPQASAAPLVQAATDGDLDGVLFLLSDGEDPNLARADNGWTPIMGAAFNGHFDVAVALIEAGAIIDRGANDQWTPLMIASQNGHEELVRLLLANGANPRLARSVGWTALHSAVLRGHAGVPQQLIQAGAPIDAADSGFTPLTLAAQEGNDAIIQLLLNSGAEVEGNPSGISPVAIASQNGRISSLELLLSAGADPDRPINGFPPIVSAAQRNQIEVINALVAAGVDLDQGQGDGMTALHWAAYNGNGALVTLLLDLGADRTIQDGHGRYPRDLAVERGHLDIAEQLSLSQTP